MLQLNPAELAWQLTLEDFKVFREIEPTEYVDELFELNSKYGCPMIQKFAEVSLSPLFIFTMSDLKFWIFRNTFDGCLKILLSL